MSSTIYVVGDKAAEQVVRYAAFLIQQPDALSGTYEDEKGKEWNLRTRICKLGWKIDNEGLSLETLGILYFEK